MSTIEIVYRVGMVTCYNERCIVAFVSIVDRENCVKLHYSSTVDGNCLMDAHWWQELKVISMYLSRSSAKKCRINTFFSW